jgi:hypothetical protein
MAAKRHCQRCDGIVTLPSKSTVWSITGQLVQLTAREIPAIVVGDEHHSRYGRTLTWQGAPLTPLNRESRREASRQEKAPQRKRCGARSSLTQKKQLAELIRRLSARVLRGRILLRPRWAIGARRWWGISSAACSSRFQLDEYTDVLTAGNRRGDQGVIS